MNNPSYQHPILLVEDNPFDVDLTLRAFDRQNIPNPVIVKRDGEEAFECITNWEKGELLPAVILLDTNLPKMSGLDVLKKTRPLKLKFRNCGQNKMSAVSFIYKIN